MFGEGSQTELKEQVTEVDVNVMKVLVPQNKTVSVIQELRGINKLVDRMKKLRELKEQVRKEKACLQKLGK